MRSIFFPVIFFSLSSIVFVSCTTETKEIIATPVVQEQRVPTDTVDATWNDLAALEEGTLFRLEGYIGDIGSYVEQVNGSISVPFFPRRNQRAGFRMLLLVKVGDGPAEVQELPAQFLPEDFKIFDTSGEGYCTTGSHVSIWAIKNESIDGKISADLTEIFNTKTIGFIPMAEMSDSVKSVVALTPEIMHDSLQSSVYCYLEGKLELPEIILPYSNEIALDLKNSSVPEIKTIDVRLGTGPGTMNDLPDNYTDADLIIRDYKSSSIPYGKKVRLYGTWERFTFESSVPGKFYLEEIEIIH